MEGIDVFGVRKLEPAQHSNLGERLGLSCAVAARRAATPSGRRRGLRPRPGLRTP